MRFTHFFQNLSRYWNQYFQKRVQEEGVPEERKMKFSENGRSILIQLEGMILYPYDDQTGKRTDVWCRGATIGVGHLISQAEWDKYKDGVTAESAENLLEADIVPFEDTVHEKVEVELNQNQFDALVMLSFNIGRTGFSNSSVLKWVNGKGSETSYSSLESAWKAWNKSQGKVMNGLVRRRNVEWELYNKEL